MRTIRTAVMTTLIVVVAIPVFAQQRPRRNFQQKILFGGAIIDGEADLSELRRRRMESAPLKTLSPTVRRAIAEIQSHGGHVSLIRDKSGWYVSFVRLTAKAHNFDDDDVRRLLHFQKLETLDLSRNRKIDGKGLAALKDLKYLRRILLSHSQISDDALKAIGQISSLKTLELGHCRITDDGLKHLAKLNNLEILDLRKTAVSDVGMKHLAALKNLKRLRLWKTDVTDAGLAEVAKLDKLEVLSLRETTVTKKGLQHLIGTKNLKYLSLRGTKITDDAMPVVRRFPAIYHLDCYQTTVTVEGLEELVGTKTLRRLVVPGDIGSAVHVELRRAIPGLGIYSPRTPFPF